MSHWLAQTNVALDWNKYCVSRERLERDTINVQQDLRHELEEVGSISDFASAVHANSGRHTLSQSTRPKFRSASIVRQSGSAKSSPSNRLFGLPDFLIGTRYVP